MTREQTEWLRMHPQHTFVGREATGVTYMAQGFVRPDGTFYDLRRGHLPVDGDVHVGVKSFTPPGSAPTAREYNER